MAYEDNEQSKHAGKPVELFKFEGTYDNYYYTTSAVVVPFEGQDYEPLPLRRSEVRAGTQSDDNLEVTIDIPVTAELVTIYGFQIAPPELKLTIYRYHNVGEYVRFWQGPVENIQVVKGTATIRVPSALAAALLGEVPNVYFQTPCNNVLFDPRCGVDYDDYSHAALITAIDGQSVTLNGIGTLNGKLIGGEAKLASGERRMIVAQAGNVLTINFPFALAEVGDACTIAAGCDLNWNGDCKNKFDNQLRHTGFPFIPPENVFSEGLEPGQNVADNTCLPPTWVPEFVGWYVKVYVRWYETNATFPGIYVDPNSGITIFGNNNTIWPGTVSAEFPGGIPYRVWDNDGKGITFYWCDPNILDATIADLRLQFNAGSHPGHNLEYANFTWHPWTVQFAGPIAPYAGESGGENFLIGQLFPQNWYFNV